MANQDHLEVRVASPRRNFTLSPRRLRALLSSQAAMANQDHREIRVASPRRNFTREMLSRVTSDIENGGFDVLPETPRNAADENTPRVASPSRSAPAPGLDVDDHTPAVLDSLESEMRESQANSEEEVCDRVASPSRSAPAPGHASTVYCRIHSDEDEDTGRRSRSPPRQRQCVRSSSGVASSARHASQAANASPDLRVQPPAFEDARIAHLRPPPTPPGGKVLHWSEPLPQTPSPTPAGQVDPRWKLISRSRTGGELWTFER